jgi:glyoxylase-like metal-dependent hydrolase (beta-lactamase superfamily II)
LLLTHVHLDHAGGAGVLARRFPELVVYVHERGAPHVVDPAKLLKSARRLYGDDMDRLWGEVAPVEAERVRALSGGEVVEGFRVAYTPGHASHHVCYLNEASGDAYTGDVAGVRVPPHELTLAPTPPPDIDFDLWLESLRTLEEWRPEAVCLTHFGRYTDVAEQFERVRSALREQGELARAGDQDAFVAGLRARLASAVDRDSQASLEQAAPPDQLFQGLERYWRKREEADAA